MELVTSGLRVWLENDFQRTLHRKLTSWQTTLSKSLKRSGFFAAAERAGRQFSRISKPRREKQKLADDLLKPAFQDIEKEWLESDERRQLEYHIRVAKYRAFEYGAVVALRQMGFRATSRRVEEMTRKAVVSKAAGDIVFELTDQEFINAIETRVVITGATTTAAVVEDTRRTVRDIVVLGGGSTQEVSEILQSGYGFPEWYGHRLSRTETHQSYEHAQALTYQRSGVKMWEWITVGDRRVRPWHVANEAAGPIPMGQPFPSGQRHPGEGALSVNCRCTTMPDLSDPNILLEPWDGSAGPYLADIPLLDGPNISPPTLAQAAVQAVTPKPPVPKKPEFVPAKTIEEAEDWAKEMGLAKRVEYGDIADVDVANRINEELYDLKLKYGVGELDGIVLTDLAEGEAAQMVRYLIGEAGENLPETMHYLNLNRDVWTNKEILRKYVRDAGTSALADPRSRGILRHEIGHYLVRVDPDDYAEAVRVYSNWSTFDSNVISTYSQVNPNEMVAEAFTHYLRVGKEAMEGTGLEELIPMFEKWAARGAG